MKKLLTLIAFISIGLTAKSQTEEPYKIYKQEKVDVTNTADTIPISASELAKRAKHWFEVSTKKYEKSNGSATSSKIESDVTFAYKPKELNPKADVQGTITMKVTIECKSGRYRYTISDVRHVAKNNTYTVGNILNPIPECGSMKIPKDMLIDIKARASKDVSMVVDEIKKAMAGDPAGQPKPNEW